MLGPIGQVLKLAGIGPKVEEQRGHPLVGEMHVFVAGVAAHPQQMLVHIGVGLDGPRCGSVVEFVVDLLVQIAAVAAHRC